MSADLPDRAPRVRRPIVRCRADAGWIALGALLLVLSALPVHPHRAPGAERSVFRAVNDGPTLPFSPVWAVMQLGNIVAVPAAALAALAARRPRLAGALALGGAAAYVLAKVVKQFVERGRPASVLGHVVIRGTPSLGLGFVSGHAGVVTVLAVVAAPWVSRRWRWAMAVVAALVCTARVYVGAHLPLDVVGGAAVGMIAGGTSRLIIGRPPPCS